MLSATEFESLLSWYLSGALDERETQQIHEYLRAHPDERWQVAWNREVRATVVAQDKDVPQDIGLKRALASLRQEEFAQLACGSGRQAEGVPTDEEAIEKQMAQAGGGKEASRDPLVRKSGRADSKGDFEQRITLADKLMRLAYVRLYEASSMRVKYDLKFRDFAAFNGIHQFLSVPIQIFYIGLAALIARISSESFGARLLTALLVYLGMWAAQQAFSLLYLGVGRYRALFTEHVVEIQDDGFYDETRFSRSTYLWPGINKVVQRLGFVAVYIRAHGAFIIPNRAFQSTEQRKQFFLTLKQKLGKAR